MILMPTINDSPNVVIHIHVNENRKREENCCTTLFKKIFCCCAARKKNNSMSSVHQDRRRWKQVKAHAKSTFCEENIGFFEETHRTDTLSRRQCLAIYNKYLSPAAPQGINISAERLQRAQHISNYLNDATLFREHKEEIYLVLKQCRKEVAGEPWTNLFERFKLENPE
jgi:hypothetical protein